MVVDQTVNGNYRGHKCERERETSEQILSQTDLGFLFEPRSVSVIGASSNKQKIGNKIIDNIVSGGYKGRVYPVNPKGGTIAGLKTYL